MKVLMVNKFLYPKGGSETYMIKLGAYLQSQGHEVQYFGMSNEKNIIKNQFNEYISNIDFQTNSLGIYKKIKIGISTIYSNEACLKMRKILKSYEPDIVHLNNINFQLTPAIIYEIKKFGIPIVQTLHDVQIACPCHRFYIEHKQQICEQCQNGAFWRCIKNRCVQKSFLKSSLASLESYYYHIRNTYNLVDLFICPSKFIANKIENAGVQKKRITVMYNFSDKIESVEGIRNLGKYAIYFGRLSHEKGLFTLINSCKKTPEIKLIIAGTGPLKELVDAEAKKYSNIKYVGFKTGDELKELIAGATFSVYPSEWYENCPLSIIESLALGTPVVASDLGGSKELIDNGKTGLIFEGCNEWALSQAMSKIWNNEELFISMKKNCYAQKSNSIEEYTIRLLYLYEKLIRLEEIKC